MSDSTVVLHDSLPGQEQFRLDVIGGLRSSLRYLPCKYFYDETGSKLFDDICELEEYYPTRTEMAIMSENIEAMTDLIGKGARLVEFGSGSSLKTRLLLNKLNSLAAYVPIDISKDYLQFSAETLKREYPDLTVQPVCADYTHPFTIPSPEGEPTKTVVYFPGSTIGNFHSEEAEAFLGQIAEAVYSSVSICIKAPRYWSRPTMTTLGLRQSSISIYCGVLTGSSTLISILKTGVTRLYTMTLWDV